MVGSWWEAYSNCQEDGRWDFRGGCSYTTFHTCCTAAQYTCSMIVLWQAPYVFMGKIIAEGVNKDWESWEISCLSLVNSTLQYSWKQPEFCSNVLDASLVYLMMCMVFPGSTFYRSWSQILWVWQLWLDGLHTIAFWDIPWGCSSCPCITCTR